jgi:hypothetical protein
VIRFRVSADHRRSKQVSAPGYGLQQFLGAIIQCAAQFDSALDQRIVRNKRVGPDSLNQFLFPDQPSGVLHQVFESLVYLGAKFDFLVAPENATLSDVQREVAKLID